MAKRNEPVHECHPEHSSMGTARMKYDEDTMKDSKKKRVNVEKSTVGTEKK